MIACASIKVKNNFKYELLLDTVIGPGGYEKREGKKGGDRKREKRGKGVLRLLNLC